MNLKIEESNIDRFHRIGPTYKDKTSSITSRSIIIKFNDWNSRQKFYTSRPKLYIRGVKQKPGEHNFKVALDLTKRRYELLKFAKEKIKINNKIDFAFADSNCSLAIKIKEGPIIHFNSKDELHSIINKY